MGAANDQIRVSETVKRELERRKREGESYNDVLKRVLGENSEANFDDGFGMLSDGEADAIRDSRERAKAKRKERTRRLADEDA
jgi:predicted CopG family antitoxin